MKRTKCKMFPKHTWAEMANDMKFSPRQEQIVLCLLQGRSDSQIAVELGMSVATVRTHMGRLFAKCSRQDRVELILHVFEHFLVGCREAGCRRIDTNGRESSEGVRTRRRNDVCEQSNGGMTR